jgi:FolB domain-containing protein
VQQTLRLQEYEVSVYLGCSAEEQKYPQAVRFTLEIQYEDSVEGAKTDKLEHATDYFILTEIIKKISKEKKYHLIEHLNLEVFNALLGHLRAEGVAGQLLLSVHKTRVPIENLKNGAVFICTEKL